MAALALLRRSLSRYTTTQLGVSARTRKIIAVRVLSGRCHMSFRSTVSGRPHYLTARNSVSKKLTVAFKTTINLDYIQVFRIRSAELQHVTISVT